MTKGVDEAMSVRKELLVLVAWILLLWLLVWGLLTLILSQGS